MRLEKMTTSGAPAEGNLTKVVDPKGRGGRSRQRILQYLVEHPGTTPYAIANEVFGSWVKYRPSVVYHLKRMGAAGLVEVTPGKVKSKVALTPKGQSFCRELGLGTGTSRRVEGLIAAIQMMSPDPVAPELKEQGRKLLNDRVLDFMYGLITSKPFMYIFPHKTEGLTSIDPVTFCVLLSVYTLEKQEAAKSLSGQLPEAERELLSELHIAKEEYRPVGIYQLVRTKGYEEEFDQLAEWMSRVRRCMPMCGEMEYWFNVVAGSVKFYSLMVNLIKKQQGAGGGPVGSGPAAVDLGGAGGGSARDE